MILIGGCLVWACISAFGFIRWASVSRDKTTRKMRQAAEWRKVAIACALLTMLNIGLGILYDWRTE